MSTDRAQPSRLVLDSLSEMRLLARDPLRYRRQILALKEYFAGRDCTVLLLDDHTSGDDDLQLQSISHGVVLLEQLPFDYGASAPPASHRQATRRRRWRAITTSRSSAAAWRCSRSCCRRASGRERAGVVSSSGHPELDALLGGGLTWGTSDAVHRAGRASANRRSRPNTWPRTAGTTPAAVYLFDERRETFIERCEALGMRHRERLGAGRLTLDQIEPGELSPGEFAHRVCQRVERRAAAS